MNHLNALCASSYGGHEKGVQLLLNNGNEVNAQDGWYGNVVQVEEAVEPLLNGADVMRKVESSATRSRRRWGEAAVRLWSCCSARALTSTRKMETMATASRRHRWEASTRLSSYCSARARTYLQGEDYGNALQAASYRCHDTFFGQVDY